ncbi:hypothetical protein B0H14DRAFT_3767951 [Mycena olivaceomarginata]|nr:hypothetical protein B0H14DRAFT_3767951 [Mycena olivaceomarginata]
MTVIAPGPNSPPSMPCREREGRRMRPTWKEKRYWDFAGEVAGSLYIITGDGKRKCIEINVDDASVGKARRAGDKDVGNINVTATVRTLSVDGGPVEDEETEVKVEELQNDGETLKALSGLQRTPVTINPTPETHAAENTTQSPATNTPSPFFLPDSASIHTHTSLPQNFPHQRKPKGALSPPLLPYLLLVSLQPPNVFLLHGGSGPTDT